MNTDPMTVNPVSYNESAGQEISLIEMMTVLREGSKIIALMAIVMALIFLSYFSIMPSSFESEAVFLPPNEADIRHFKMPTSLLNEDDMVGVKEVTVDTVYSMFQRQLESQHVRRQVFTELKLHERFQSEVGPDISIEKAYAFFSDSFSFNFPSKEESAMASPKVLLAVTASDGAFAHKVSERLLQLAIKETISMFFSNIQVNVARQKARIEADIKSLRDGARRNRLDKISRLKEYAGIAHVLGMKEPLLYKGGEQDEVRQSITDSAADMGEMYNRGYAALEATLSVLASRENDDPFIDTLFELQSKLIVLDAITYENELSAVVTVDVPASLPIEPTGLSGMLMAIIGLLVGCFVGVFYVLIKHAAQDVQRPSSSV
ncbi:MAG: Wzz/FepE/Etk N-terminal domain-containing protein [Planctomycetota bacterium]|nr:Wzz/FepE/Etk N-terminal domain-containing protein [Planctomycetota bacterium]